MAVGSEWPADAVEVGIVTGPWGVKGWIRIKPHAADPQALFATRRWYLRPPAPGVRAVPQQLAIAQAREHGDAIIAQAHDVDDRAAAEALRGARIFVSRQSFPTADPDEYYWIDLIGLAVVNRQGEALGSVVGLIDTGPHSVLRVAADAAVPPDAERLVPFVAAYVDSVSLEQRRIVVDWGLDY